MLIAIEITGLEKGTNSEIETFYHRRKENERLQRELVRSHRIAFSKIKEMLREKKKITELALHGLLKLQGLS